MFANLSLLFLLFIFIYVCVCMCVCAVYSKKVFCDLFYILFKIFFFFINFQKINYIRLDKYLNFQLTMPIYIYIYLLIMFVNIILTK